MNWIGIDIHDENANVPEVDEMEQKILCYYRTLNNGIETMNFDVGRYTGFRKPVGEDSKCHKFYIGWDPPYLSGLTHWCQLDKPELSVVSDENRMNWNEIDIHNEKAKVPERKQEALCYHKVGDMYFFGVAKYAGFNKFSKDLDEGYHLFHNPRPLYYEPFSIWKVTHWCELVAPEKSVQT